MRAHLVRAWLLFVVVAAAAQAADPVLGTWELDVAKSSYKPGPPPKSQTRIYELLEDGVKVTILTTYADGRTAKVEHPANFDGKDYPVTGSSGAYAISLRKIDDYTSESVLKHASTILGRVKRVVSPDGKTMTVSYSGLDGSGRNVENVAVYDKR